MPADSILDPRRLRVRRSASSDECNADYLRDSHACPIRAAVGFVTIAASSRHARNFYKESRQADKVCRRCGSDRRGRLRAIARTSMPSSTRHSTWSLTVEGLAAFPSDGTLLSARGKYTSIDVPSTDGGRDLHGTAGLPRHAEHHAE